MLKAAKMKIIFHKMNSKNKINKKFWKFSILLFFIIIYITIIFQAFGSKIRTIFLKLKEKITIKKSKYVHINLRENLTLIQQSKGKTK